MGFYRIYPQKDNWITDGHALDSVTTRGTGSNHGRSPALNVFARKGDINSSSIELARTLVQFPITELSGLIYDDQKIPSGNITYTLKMFNHVLDDTLPSSYEIFVYPLSRSWNEGNGIDDDNHQDLGFASWVDATSTQPWTTTGSDFITSGYGSGSQSFDLGDEDLEVDITDIVNSWLTGTLNNYGVVVKLGDTEESNGNDYYRKGFHGRETQFVEKLPYIEARWADVIKDHRKNFGFDVNNNLLLYNVVRGELTQPSTPLSVEIKDSLVSGSALYEQSFTPSEVEPGIFSASVFLDSTGSYSGSVFYDIWTDSAGKPLLTGNFLPQYFTASQVDDYDQFTVNVNNLQRVYRASDEVRMVVTVREKDFVTHRGILGSASLNVEKKCIERMYYSIMNDENGETIVPFGTGSTPHTQLSYNADGNYFNLWMNSFVPGFKYRLLFLIEYNKNDKKIVDNDFTFKVI